MAHKPLRPKNTLSTTIPVGVHKLKIVGFESKKHPSGKPMLDPNGNIVAITVTFQDEKGREKVKHFPLSEKMLWMLENLSSALNINLLKNDQYDVDTEIIGKYVYGVILVVQYTKGGVQILDDQGNPKSFVDLDSKFYEDMPLGGPRLSGSTSRSEPSGHFLKFIEQK